jgi:hypothetical protein
MAKEKNMIILNDEDERSPLIPKTAFHHSWANFCVRKNSMITKNNALNRGEIQSSFIVDNRG